MVITMVVQRHDDVINRNIIIPRRLVGCVESVFYMYIYIVCDIQTFIDVTLQRIPFSIYIYILFVDCFGVLLRNGSSDDSIIYCHTGIACMSHKCGGGIRRRNLKSRFISRRVILQVYISKILYILYKYATAKNIIESYVTTEESSYANPFKVKYISHSIRRGT